MLCLIKLLFDCVYLALIMKNATQNDRNQIKYFFSFLDCLGLNVLIFKGKGTIKTTKVQPRNCLTSITNKLSSAQSKLRKAQFC